MQKTLVIILIIVIVVLSGIMIWQNLENKAPVVNNQPPVSDETASWKTYKNSQLEFKYPQELVLQEKESQVSLTHSIAYKHGNPCDFKGDGTVPALEKLTDFNVSFRVFNQGLKETLQSSAGSDNVFKNFFENNTFKLSQGFIDTFNAGSLRGFQITSGAEGCGEFTYYFPISETKTLFARRAFITEFSPIIGDYQTSLKLPGIINPSQEIDFFTKILSSFKVY